MIFVWLVLPWRFDFGGGPLLAFNAAGAGMAFGITLKSNSIFLAWVALLYQIPFNNILQALGSWRVSPKLLALLFFIYRYGLILRGEYARMQAATRTRGFRPRLNWHSLRTISQLAACLLLRGFDRAERVYQAMLCRGFSGQFYFFNNLKWQKNDTMLAITAGAGLTLLCVSGYF